MTHKILGLHHVTATVDAAQADLDFCRELLGLRLVKKTVNFDNHDVYHFYYGTERGAPGTIWTTFPYRDHGVRRGVKGASQVVTTSFSVPATALGFWRRRLQQHGVEARYLERRFGEEAIRFVDPSGLWFELVGSPHDTRPPWLPADGTIGAGNAIRGLHSVTMLVRALAPTLELMTGLLGYRVIAQNELRTRVAAGGQGPGHTIDIAVDPVAELAVNGIGTVHHVAMAIGSAEEQLDLRAELLARGFEVTEVRDRCYFQSIYFREPGGVLFEVATVEPGFTADEELATLGRGLQLPPWEESHRAAIEAGLPPIVER
jgi:glyoxalase family protein